MNLCYLGTKMPYSYHKTKETPLPQGYQPFYVNFLARHGARYLENTDDLMWMTYALMNAKKQNGLLPMGEILERQLEGMAAYQEKRFGYLTMLGMHEIRQIAKRVFEQYPEVFGRNVYASSTCVERTKQSMNAFLKEMSLYTDHNHFYAKSYEREDPILRFFDLNEAYLSYRKREPYQKYLQSYELRKPEASCLMKRFLSNWYLMYFKSKKEFAEILFSLFCDGYDTHNHVSLGCFFSERELQYFSENENLKQYFMKGPSCLSHGLSSNISFGLMLDFIKTSDNAINSGDVSANLRFAHAETLIPFAAFLELPFANHSTKLLPAVKYLWRAERIAPMAGNLAWIFYRNPESNRILVKMKYNEQEVHFPFRMQLSPYYLWDEVKAYYMQKIVRLGVDVQENLTEEVRRYTGNTD